MFERVSLSSRVSLSLESVFSQQPGTSIMPITCEVQHSESLDSISGLLEDRKLSPSSCSRDSGLILSDTEENPDVAINQKRKEYPTTSVSYDSLDPDADDDADFSDIAFRKVDRENRPKSEIIHNTDRVKPTRPIPKHSKPKTEIRFEASDSGRQAPIMEPKRKPSQTDEGERVTTSLEYLPAPKCSTTSRNHKTW